MSEEWRTIAAFPNYEVSSLGRVRRVAGGSGAVIGRILRPIVKDGYQAVSLGSGRRHHLVHRLVAEAFHGPPPFPDAEAAHKDGSRAKNASENLYWATRFQNAADRDRHGTTARGERSGMARLSDEDVQLIRAHVNYDGNPLARTARLFGISKSQCFRIARGQSRREAGGYL
jgi:HNH endonuclease/NUMOD4 motif